MKHPIAVDVRLNGSEPDSTSNLVALAKILGIETEYGIAQTQGFMDPVLASTILVNAYAAAQSGKVRWDFFDEAPGRDARGRANFDAMPPMVETHLANTVLTNGARFYVDHAHPEYSSPECSSALEAVTYDVAGELVLRRAVAAAAQMKAAEADFVVYKNNSDGKGNSYGCHENYLVDRALSFEAIVASVIPHFITRSVFCGAGKVGAERRTEGEPDVAFQLTQRADFFEEVVGLETTVKRPLVNTRDEPHADPKRFRRLHVIIGDANMSEVATFLKLSTTALVLAMAEHHALPQIELMPADPVQAFRHISRDVSLRAPFLLESGRLVTAIDVQWALFEAAVNFAEREGLEMLGADRSGLLCLARWEEVLTQLERNPEEAASTVDWVAKHRLVEGFRERHGLEPTSAKLRAIDLQYHDLRPEKSLALRVGLERLSTDDQTRTAEIEPPQTTRAFFRGRCISRYQEAVESANWDSVVFDLGSDPLRRVPMMDPTRGTAEETSALFETSPTAVDLLQALES